MTQPCQRSRGGSSELLLAASGLPGGRGPALLLSQMEKTKTPRTKARRLSIVGFDQGLLISVERPEAVTPYTSAPLML